MMILSITTFFDIGVAVGTERGLVVPIGSRRGSQEHFADLERAIAEYATKAREGKVEDRRLAGRHASPSPTAAFTALS